MVLFQFWSALSRHAWLRSISVGYFFSAFAGGLVFIVAYGEMAQLEPTNLDYTLMYISSVLPGLVGSYINTLVVKKFGHNVVLIAGEIAGLLGLFLPFLGLFKQNTTLLILSEFTAAFTFGLTLPSLHFFLKSKLSDSELGVAAGYDSVVFAINILLGGGIGFLCFGIIKSEHLLTVALISYILAIAFICKTNTELRQPTSHQFTDTHD